MPIEPLTQQQSWVRGKRAFLSSPAKLEEGGKGPFPLRQLSLGRGKRPFPLIQLGIQDFYIWDYYINPTK
jgi:hypothetical protein